MFMMDMQGTLAAAMACIKCRTSGSLYCGSCIARHTRS